MNNFFCQHCGERLFFENTLCLGCGSQLGFLPDRLLLAVIHSEGTGLWRVEGGEADGLLYRQCRNYSQEDACNWMIPTSDTEDYCLACRLNRTIPDLSVAHHRDLWKKLEAAKRRLIFTLISLRLPVVPKSQDPHHGLAFDFLADPAPAFGQGQSDRVLTGHAGGIITLNLAEADDAVREKMRLNMREVYRTLLGHFRHESGHYFWDLLVRDHPGIHEVRAVFGDDRQDYGQALDRHYQQGAPSDWQERFVSPYASAHPWEDWAESWAHYLHILDTLQSAAAGGVQIAARDGMHPIRNPFCLEFAEIRADWHALRFILNSLNRSMGLSDAYPFVLSDHIAAKLAFIHEWIRSFRLNEVR